MTSPKHRSPGKRVPRKAKRKHFRRLRALPWRWILGIGFLLTVVIAVVPPFRRAASLGTSRFIAFVLTPLAPDISDFDQLPQGSRIVDIKGNVVAELSSGQDRSPVILADLPAYVPEAVLAAEDKDFYHHAGVDPLGIARAVYADATGGRQGGSTITQQLAKNNYVGSQRTGARKLREVLYAVKLEDKFTKDQLLERYLNQVYFGAGAYGLGAAAQEFFGVDAKHLSIAQAATLAGKIRSPEGLDPRKNPAGMIGRRNDVLNAMARNKSIDPASLAVARAAPLDLVAHTPTTTASTAPDFTDLVKHEANGIQALGSDPNGRLGQLQRGGYTVQTTLDPKVFQASVDAIKAKLGADADPATVTATIVPGDGAVRALVGGQSFGRDFNASFVFHRQPGSSFKPFVYLAMLREGIDPRSTFDTASPKTLTYNGKSFTVSNAEPGDGGAETVDNALVHSVNVVFSQLILKTTPENVVKVAKDLGITETVNPDPAIALGGLTLGVNPVEMAAAYGTFAAAGTFAAPYTILKITDRSGKVVYSHTKDVATPFNAQQVGVLTSALSGVVTQGTGKAAAIGRPVAGKTGTTTSFVDAWFVGYTPQLATAVWVGDPNGNVPMKNVHGRAVFGGTFPAQIFGQLMKASLDGVPSVDLATATPDGLKLKVFNGGTPTTTSTSSTTTSSTTTSTSIQGTTTITGPKSTTTTAGGGGPTTTKKPPKTTTTTAAGQGPPPTGAGSP